MIEDYFLKYLEYINPEEGKEKKLFKDFMKDTFSSVYKNIKQMQAVAEINVSNPINKNNILSDEKKRKLVKDTLFEN